MEDNRLIAEFMGWKSHKYDNLPNRLHKELKYGEIAMNLSECFYDIDWNQLMPVLSKIKSLGFDYAICSITIGGEELSEIMISPIVKGDNIEIHTRTDKSLIQATYNAVVQFITWHNM